MTPQERLRAGAAVRARMVELGLTPPALGHRAGVDPTTVRALIAGSRWPTRRTRGAICEALGWPQGEILRLTVES